MECLTLPVTPVVLSTFITQVFFANNNMDIKKSSAINKVCDST